MNRLTSILTAFVLLFSVFGLKAQGINFEHGDVAAIKELAQKENKIIFIDCLTDWCGPCKWMSANTFTDPQVGEFFNENFVNYKLDMEKGEGIEFAKKYNVRAYPTLLFIDGNGEIVHIGIGAKDAAGFIELGKSALNPEENIKGLGARYDNGEKDAEFLGNYLKLLNSSRMDFSNVLADWQNAVKPKDLTNEFHWSVFEELFSDSKNEYFKYVVQNYDVFATALGEETVNQKILNTYRQDLLVAISNDNEDEVKQVKNTIQKSSIDGAEKMVLTTEMALAGRAKDWDQYKSLAQTVAKKHADDDWELLNSIAWTYYEQFDDRADLKKAVNWAEKSVEIEAHYYNLDTYGMLLAKLGESQDAKIQLASAIEKANEEGLDASATEKALQEIE